MNELLQTLDCYLTASFPYVLVITLMLIAPKALGYSSYSWLVAGLPVFLMMLIVGAVKLLRFYLDQD